MPDSARLVASAFGADVLGQVLPDDIVSLSKHVKMEKFSYVDVSSEHAWEDSLRRWPLLAELNALHGDTSP